MDTLQDFLELIPATNSIKPKFMQWMADNIQPGVDSIDAMQSMVEAFDIDSAVGIQLDIIGDILKLSRVINFEPIGNLSPILEDEDYRLILKAKIIKNHWKGTISEIYTFWNEFFPTVPVIVRDNGDMSLGVLVINMPIGESTTISFGYDLADPDIAGYDIGYWGSTFPGIRRQLVANGYFFPKPAGVQISYSFQDNPIFAYDLENQNLKGYNEGAWASFIE